MSSLMSTTRPSQTPEPVTFGGTYGLLINGRTVTTGRTFNVLNPATNEILARAPDASAEDLNDAVAAARKAFRGWSALSYEERGAYLEAFADALEAQKEDFITLLTLEQGKPRNTQAAFEVNLAHPWIRESARCRLDVTLVQETADHVVEVHRTPLGVVGAIAPWNYPYLLALWKLCPALITGNTIVLKPSPFTPLCTLRMGDVAKGIFPPGVINILSGGSELGQALTEHPGIEKLSFTGSTATGQKVMASGARSVKRVTLELGGNDPAILLPDADWKPLVPQIFWSAMGNSGQWCCAAKRIYVHRSFHAEFVHEFVKFAQSIVVGDGMDPKSDLGPINNRMQFNKLIELFKDTKEKGYRVPLGGTIDESQAGNFVPITVVDNPPEDSRIVKEEPFGPIVPIIAYDEIEEVISKANDSPYGLGATVWGRDRKASIAVAQRIDSGTVWVNETQNHGVGLPFGGHKRSGFGVEHGREGLEAYTNSKTVMIHK